MREVQYLSQSVDQLLFVLPKYSLLQTSHTRTALSVEIFSATVGQFLLFIFRTTSLLQTSGVYRVTLLFSGSA